MRDAALTLEDPAPLQLALLDTQALEQPAAVAEQHRNQMDLDLATDPVTRSPR